MKTFLRRDNTRYSKLGKRRKKKQKWQSPKGRDNKMREKRKGYPAVVSLGYKTDKKDLGKIKEKTPVVILKIEDLKNIKKENIGVIGKVGKKRKLEIAKKAQEEKKEIYNLNPKTYLKKNKMKGIKENKK